MASIDDQCKKHLLNVEAIRRRFPRWSMFQSDTGRWWATRRRALTVEDERAGLLRTVDADSLEELQATLERQEELAESQR